MKHGFSLIELIVAIAISSGIAVLLFQIYNQSSRVLSRVESMVSMNMKLVTFYDRFEKDITGAFIPLIGDLDLAKRVLEKHEGEIRTQQVRQQDQGAQEGKGPSTAKKSIKPVTLGDIQVKKSFIYEQKNNKLSVLSFITCNPLEVYKQIKPRIARVTYVLEGDPSEKGTYKLIRKESQQLRFGTVKRERGFVLLNHLKSLHLELLATEPDKEEVIKPEDVQKDEKTGTKDKKKEHSEKMAKKEESKEEKPKPLKSYTQWPPDQKKDKPEQKRLPRDLPQFVKVFITYADPFEGLDKAYEFIIPIFNYQAPTKEVLAVPLLVQERLKKEEEEAVPRPAKNKGKAGKGKAGKGSKQQPEGARKKDEETA